MCCVLGGPCGENRRTFVDEVVMYTRLHTPLIGIRHWKNVHQDVKNSIAESIMVYDTIAHLLLFSILYNISNFIHCNGNLYLLFLTEWMGHGEQ